MGDAWGKRNLKEFMKQARDAANRRIAFHFGGVTVGLSQFFFSFVFSSEGRIKRKLRSQQSFFGGPI